MTLVERRDFDLDRGCVTNTRTSPFTIAQPRSQSHQPQSSRRLSCP